jgi:hypothetical protein
MDTVANPTWRKSSYTGTDGGNCVEVGVAAQAILVRDTKNRAGVALSISGDAWRAFIKTLS